MPLEPGILAAGQVASSTGTLYAASTGPDFITLITLYNTGGSTETVIVYLQKNGETRRKIRRIELGSTQSYEFTNRIALAGGDEIQAETTTGSTVDFTVNGAATT